MVIEFSLPTSCYATMAIREVCEVDTSQAHQAIVSKDLKPSKPENESDEATAAPAPDAGLADTAGP